MHLVVSVGTIMEVGVSYGVRGPPVELTSEIIQSRGNLCLFIDSVSAIR